MAVAVEEVAAAAAAEAVVTGAVEVAVVVEGRGGEWAVPVAMMGEHRLGNGRPAEEGLATALVATVVTTGPLVMTAAVCGSCIKQARCSACRCSVCSMSAW